MDSSETQTKYEQLMAQARAEYSHSIEAIEDFQKKVERIKHNPIILTKRRYCLKEVVESSSS